MSLPTMAIKDLNDNIANLLRDAGYIIKSPYRRGEHDIYIAIPKDQSCSNFLTMLLSGDVVAAGYEANHG